MPVQEGPFAIGKRKYQPKDCEYIRNILARIGDKWTVAVLIALGDKCVRFNDLHRSIAGISQRMLIVTLRHLERDGMMTRTVYPTVPPRVEYELSEHGRSLRDAFDPVAAWVLAHRRTIEEAQRHFDLKNRKTDEDHDA